MKLGILLFLMLASFDTFGVDVEESLDSEQQLDLARLDLVARVNGISDKDVEVLNVRHVTWPSSALGCPKPGFEYTQALVEGVLISLSVNGNHFRYHAKKGSEPFYCAEKFVQSPGLPASDL